MTPGAAARESAAAIHVPRGGFAIGGADDGPIVTVLGSCVATCLFDSLRGIGGLNHFMLPDCAGSARSPASFGVHAMELLINALLAAGADRGALRAKVFGGARVIAGLSDIGALNAEFVRGFLARERIACVGESLGGAEARRIEFWPADGRVRQRRLGDARRAVIPAAAAADAFPQTGDLDLF